jgi:hypothetical protein
VPQDDILKAKVPSHQVVVFEKNVPRRQKIRLLSTRFDTFEKENSNDTNFQPS